MFGRQFQLFRLFGFPVAVDLSWFVIATLLTWSLARSLFPAVAPELGQAVYWILGVLGTIGLFASVILHELAHALAARRFGLEIRGITLFIFGGVAQMDREPPHPKAEFVVAVAGPALSFVLAGAFFASSLPLAVAGESASALSFYLGITNAFLAGFNLVPAFPLDGGRMLRALLWQWRGSLRRATRITARIGSAFGWALIGLGILRAMIGGDLVGAIWFVLIGMFLRNAARTSYQGLVVRRTLEGEPVSQFMEADPITVSRALTIAELVERYILGHRHKMFPVVDDGKLLGLITARAVRQLPREEWSRQSVAALLEPTGPENTVRPEADALQALAQMNRTGTSRLLVADGDRLAGIVSLKDLLGYLSLRLQLEEGEQEA